MRKVYEYSHLGGSEILHVRYSQQEQEIDSIIQSVKAQRTKVSKEHGQEGRMLYNPTQINEAFTKKFREYGYEELREYFTIKIDDPAYKMKRRSFKQIDFVKGNLLVEVQFGKYAFMFYDMAKFQYFFNELLCCMNRWWGISSAWACLADLHRGYE